MRDKMFCLLASLLMLATSCSDFEELDFTKGDPALQISDAIRDNVFGIFELEWIYDNQVIGSGSFYAFEQPMVEDDGVMTDSIQFIAKSENVDVAEAVAISLLGPDVSASIWDPWNHGNLHESYLPLYTTPVGFSSSAFYYNIRPKSASNFDTTLIIEGHRIELEARFAPEKCTMMFDLATCSWTGTLHIEKFSWYNGESEMVPPLLAELLDKRLGKPSKKIVLTFHTTKKAYID